MTRRITTAAIGLLTLVGLTAVKCEGTREGQVRTDRNPVDRQVDPARKRTVTITASVKRKHGLPAKVNVEVYEVDKPVHRESSQEYLTSTVGEYTQTVDYTEGTRLHIYVKVDPAKGYAGAMCTIRDGDVFKVTGPVNDAWSATCEHYTSM